VNPHNRKVGRCSLDRGEVQWKGVKLTIDLLLKDQQQKVNISACLPLSPASDTSIKEWSQSLTVLGRGEGGFKYLAILEYPIFSVRAWSWRRNDRKAKTIYIFIYYNRLLLTFPRTRAPRGLEEW
jgi:hypothetical protein